MILVFDEPRGIHAGLRRALEQRGQIVTIDHETDRGSMKQVRDRVLLTRPTAIVVASTVEDPEEGEIDPDGVFRRAAEDLIHVAAAALEARAKTFLLSTAEVFGQKGGPFGEGDDPEPPCEWARSKRKGEEFLLRAQRDAVVLRAGPILSDGLPRIRELLESPVEASPEELVTPIGIEDVAEAIVALLRAGARGLFHLAPAEPPPSRAELLKACASAIGLPEDRVIERRSAGLVRLGRSPTLFGDKIRPLLGRAPDPWRVALERAATAARELPRPPPASG
jgi:dTDP-4-dehydrorhamnose reductase